jgi:hypothetical protein
VHFPHEPCRRHHDLRPFLWLPYITSEARGRLAGWQWLFIIDGVISLSADSNCGPFGCCLMWRKYAERRYLKKEVENNSNKDYILSLEPKVADPGFPGDRLCTENAMTLPRSCAESGLTLKPSSRYSAHGTSTLWSCSTCESGPLPRYLNLHSEPSLKKDVTLAFSTTPSVGLPPNPSKTPRGRNIPSPNRHLSYDNVRSANRHHSH